MSENKKIDCKYWDKCYQKNVAHHEKYNHPPNIQLQHQQQQLSLVSSSSTNDDKDKTKRRSSSTDNNENDTSKKQKLSPTSSKSPKKQPASTSRIQNESSSENASKSSSSSDEQEEYKKDENGKPKEMDITKEYNEAIDNLSNSGKNYFEIFQKRVRYSQKAEYDDLLKTPEFIRHKFLVEMPSDFYKLWDFCTLLSEKDENKSKNILPQKIFEKFGLHLVGPFDYLSGNFNNAKICEPGNYLRHWRFYYDPPEFQTLFWKNKTTIHYGYWRDEPKANENLLMARNDADKGCEFEFIGGNCFETVLYFLDNDCASTPFNRKQITEMKKLIEQYALENKISLNSLNKIKKDRDKNVVCKTFHKAGLVVPFNHKTEVGYRSLIESDANIKKILSKLDKMKDGDKKEVAENVIEALQPVITAANIAIDESDFGTAVELGIDLFCSGYKELHDVIRSLLIPGYSMLDRPQFIAIMKAHLEDRKKGYDLSIFN